MPRPTHSRTMLGMSIFPKNMAALTEFAEVAQDYCVLIDSLSKGKPKDFYKKLQSLLGKLAYLILPVEQAMSEAGGDQFEHLDMTNKQRQELSRNTMAAISTEVEELVAWHEETLEEGDRAFMLFDDLAGIYGDLHYGLAIWREGTPDGPAEAAWEWRYNYDIHWAHHLFRAMTTVHEMLYDIMEH